jgi:hypothetical protein
VIVKKRIGAYSWLLIPAAAVLLPLAVAVGQPWRALAAIALFCVLPGLALAHWLPVGDRLTYAVVAIALSLSLTTLISTALFFAHQWTWQRCAGTLIAITVLASLPRLTASRRRSA